MNWLIKTDNLNTFAEFSADEFSELIIDVTAGETTALIAAVEKFPRAKIRWALPTIIRDNVIGKTNAETATLRQKVETLRKAGFNQWEISQLGTLAWLPDADLAADWSLYTLNTFALEFLQRHKISRFTASPEDDRENLQALLAAHADKLAVILYQDTPLFIGEACPQAAANNNDEKKPRGDNAVTCATCQTAWKLQTSRGQDYRAIVNNCSTTIYSEQAYCISQDLAELRAAGLQYARVDFLLRAYPAATARQLFAQIQTGVAIPATHQGNYRRRLQ